MTAAQAPLPLDDVDDADVAVVDVLVVGLGSAGACAAIEAARADADTLVLERTSGGGGSSAMSGGEVYLGGGTALQRACGVDDTPEDMFAFLEAALGPHADPGKLRSYCDGSVEHFDWLVDAGVEFGTGLYDQPTWMPPTTDGLMWLGENTWPFTEVATPAPRGHRPGTPNYAGAPLMQALLAAARTAGARTESDVLARRLVVDGDRVVGVVGRRFGKDLAWLARRGVIVTTGGFVDNDRMLADHAPSLLGHGKVSDGLDDGSGIQMGMAVGGHVRRMGTVETALPYVPALAARGILVDRTGQRFINEDTYPGLVSHAAVHHDHLPVWTVVDEQGWEEVAEADRWGTLPAHVAATPEELEEDLGMASDTLAATIRTYNHHAADGIDPTHHKQPPWVRPLVGPLAAVGPAAPGGADPADTGVAGFTLGGLDTTIDGQVLDVMGSPLAGLYAAGRAACGMHGGGYISGTSLGDATFFGRRAGTSAAANAPALQAHDSR